MENFPISKEKEKKNQLHSFISASFSENNEIARLKYLVTSIKINYSA